jgi:hypothetical protein
MKLIKILWILLTAGSFLPVIAGNAPGVTETIFNRRFIPTIKPSLSYEQLTQLAGGIQGEKINESKDGAAKILNYRWHGGKKSILTVKLRDNKLIEATVLAPNGHTYKIQMNGQVLEAP